MSAKSPGEEGDGMLTENRLSYSYRCASLLPPTPAGARRFPVMGYRGCATGWGRIFTTGLTTTGSPFQALLIEFLEWSRTPGGGGVLPHENDEGTRRKLSKAPLKVTRISFCGRGFEFIYTP